MRIDYLMRPTINTLEGYEKIKLNNSIFIKHTATEKVLFIINEALKVYRIKKIKGIKSKTYEDIESYLKSKGYKKI